MTGRAMGSHQSARPQTEVWLTPPEVIAALGGWESFDVDPCGPFRSPIRTARRVLPHVFYDGLREPWRGRAYLNPPYRSGVVGLWMRRLADHGRGTALIFARTDTENWAQNVRDRAAALLFIEGRLHFHYPDGSRAPQNAGAPSVLCAYGQDDAEILAQCGIDGMFVPLKLPRYFAIAALAGGNWVDDVVAWAARQHGPISLDALYRRFVGSPRAAANQNVKAKLRQIVAQRGPFERVSRGVYRLAREAA